MLILIMFKYKKFKLCTIPKSWLINKQKYNATKKKHKSREHLKGVFRFNAFEKGNEPRSFM